MTQHIYVCLFSNGFIKVGRSINPEKRILSHAERVSCFGVQLTEHVVYKCSFEIKLVELALIRKCESLALKRHKNEWFEGLDYQQVVSLAHVLSETEPMPVGKRKAVVKGKPQNPTKTKKTKKTKAVKVKAKRQPKPETKASAVRLSVESFLQLRKLMQHYKSRVWLEDEIDKEYQLCLEKGLIGTSELLRN